MNETWPALLRSHGYRNYQLSESTPSAGRLRRRLKASHEELFEALQGELTASRRFVLNELMVHIEDLEVRIARFETYLLSHLEAEANTLSLVEIRNLRSFTLIRTRIDGAALDAGA